MEMLSWMQRDRFERGSGEPLLSLIVLGFCYVIHFGLKPMQPNPISIHTLYKSTHSPCLVDYMNQFGLRSIDSAHPSCPLTAPPGSFVNLSVGPPFRPSFTVVFFIFLFYYCY